MGRAEQRKGRPVEIHLEDLDNDMDRLERFLTEFQGAMRAQTRMLFGILVTLATSAVLLALNLGVAR